jgi:hypothetical protein
MKKNLKIAEIINLDDTDLLGIIENYEAYESPVILWVFAEIKRRNLTRSDLIDANLNLFLNQYSLISFEHEIKKLVSKYDCNSYEEFFKVINNSETDLERNIRIQRKLSIQEEKIKKESEKTAIVNAGKSLVAAAENLLAIFTIGLFSLIINFIFVDYIYKNKNDYNWRPSKDVQGLLSLINIALAIATIVFSYLVYKNLKESGEQLQNYQDE